MGDEKACHAGLCFMEDHWNRRVKGIEKDDSDV
jgi:hypothetical protein